MCFAAFRRCVITRIAHMPRTRDSSARAGVETCGHRDVFGGACEMPSRAAARDGIAVAKRH
jgi:hypothetical protein